MCLLVWVLLIDLNCVGLGDRQSSCVRSGFWVFQNDHPPPQLLSWWLLSATSQQWIPRDNRICLVEVLTTQCRFPIGLTSLLMASNKHCTWSSFSNKPHRVPNGVQQILLDEKLWMLIMFQVFVNSLIICMCSKQSEVSSPSYTVRLSSHA